ncbi:MAG: hypothetical protein IJE16_08820 [Ruminococcus sp.]|nr:hypothetical protein [Ruminococcus sp.]
MKKFWTISIILVLVSAIIFSGSLFYYISETREDEATFDQLSPTEPTEKVEGNKTGGQVPAEFLDGGIFSKNYEKAYAYMQSMSTEQMVGQLIIGTCPADDSAKSLISKYALSGLYFTDDNFYSMSVDEIKSAISSYQSSAKTPMIMSVEEEGGAVTALSDLDAFPDYDFASPRDTFAEGGMDAVKEMETQKATMLSSVGINLNLSPVLDMAQEFTQIMYSRSLGGTVQDASQYAKDATSINQGKGVSVALKHFPGYGTIPDTYEPVVVDDREKSIFETNDFKPFEAGVDAGAHCVLVSNVFVESLDSSCISSLSENTHKILRNDIGFTGLIITDNLNNADYSEYANGKDVYVQAVLAGNDVIMVDEIEDAYTAILNAVNDGTISSATLQQACMRVLAYKYTTGLLK